MRRAGFSGFLCWLLLFAGGSGITSAATTSGEQTYWGNGVEAVLPANAAPGSSQVQINWVSCASAGNCSAVGTYRDRSGNTEGLLLTETAGVWATGVEAVLPANAWRMSESAQTVQINSVSCASAGNCSAVGSYLDSSVHDKGLLLVEKAGRWTSGVEAALPANAEVANQDVFLYSVSCVSASNCTAVGSYLDSLGAEGLLLTETAGVWATGVEAVLPANTNAGESVVSIDSVSCASAGNCSAVGTYFDASDNRQGLLLTETAGVWATGVEAALPANAVSTGQIVVLTSVSCASAGNCSAVGDYNHWSLGRDDPGGGDGLLLTQTAGTWSAGVEAALPANSAGRAAMMDQARLTSVSCASAGDCSAVGTYLGASDERPGLLLTETAGSWSSGIAPVLPANANGYAVLNSVSCASAGNCSAVGFYDDSVRAEGLLLTETTDSWATGVEAGLPSNAVSGDFPVLLTSVSCPSAQDCTGVGSYGVDSNGETQGLLLGGSAPPPCIVPKLKGKTLDAAKHSIKSHSCSIGKIKHHTSRTIKKGRVIAQKPKPGRQLNHGATISLLVSKGHR